MIFSKDHNLEKNKMIKAKNKIAKIFFKNFREFLYLIFRIKTVAYYIKIPDFPLKSKF
jgi:hypothetical protein